MRQFTEHFIYVNSFNLDHKFMKEVTGSSFSREKPKTQRGLCYNDPK
jgi:hypothetical protein